MADKVPATVRGAYYVRVRARYGENVRRGKQVRAPVCLPEASLVESLKKSSRGGAEAVGPGADVCRADAYSQWRRRRVHVEGGRLSLQVAESIDGFWSGR